MNNLVSRFWRRKTINTTIRFVVLVAFAIVILFPLVWIISGSLKPLAQVFEIPVRWIPDPIQWRNYPDAWGLSGQSEAQNYHLTTNFNTNLVNSVIVTAAQVLIRVLFCALAGYGFAKHNFPGKEVVFILVLGMSLLPLQIIMIPLFVIVKQLNWINSYQGLILPTAIDAFAIFFMRQFVTSIPSDYVDAARVDGAGELGIFFRIIIPMSGPALVTLAVLTSLESWDAFLWPLIVVSDQKLATLPLGIAYLKSLYQAPAHWLLAVSVVMALPLLIVFIFAQRRIIESAAQTGIKG
jgi:multiple sugar transport system permease protein